jgi:hypothetical protein
MVSSFVNFILYNIIHYGLFQREVTVEVSLNVEPHVLSK